VSAALSASAPARLLAPFSRRAARVIERRAYGTYVVLRCADPDSRAPAKGVHIPSWPWAACSEVAMPST
jgi:hypothetical protein